MSDLGPKGPLVFCVFLDTKAFQRGHTDLPRDIIAFQEGSGSNYFSKGGGGGCQYQNF